MAPVSQHDLRSPVLAATSQGRRTIRLLAHDSPAAPATRPAGPCAGGVMVAGIPRAQVARIHPRSALPGPPAPAATSQGRRTIRLLAHDSPAAPATRPAGPCAGGVMVAGIPRAQVARIHPRSALPGPPAPAATSHETGTTHPDLTTTTCPNAPGPKPAHPSSPSPHDSPAAPATAGLRSPAQVAHHHRRWTPRGPQAPSRGQVEPSPIRASPGDRMRADITPPKHPHRGRRGGLTEG